MRTPNISTFILGPIVTFAFTCAAEAPPVTPSAPLTNYVIQGGAAASAPASTSGAPAGPATPGAFTITDTDRIVVRPSTTFPTFAMKNSGRALSLRGVNWNRSEFRNLPNGQPEWWYHTFDVGAYDAAAVEQSMAQIQLSKYHYVRVFISGQNPDAGFGMSTSGIDPKYLANVADFLRKAKKHDLFVVLTGQFMSGQWLPKNYLSLTSPVANVEGSNQLVMNPSYAKALGQFYVDLLKGLKALPNDPTTSLFAIDVHNEISVNKLEKPFSLATGSFPYDGRTYDLGNSDRRQALIDAASVSWLNTITGFIRKVDGNVLVTASVFTVDAVSLSGFNGALLSEPGDGSGRYPLNPRAIAASNADFVDVHIYPFKPPYSFDKDMAKENMANIQALGKPVLMGELGAFKSAFPTRETATNALNDVISKSCSFGFSGWGFWTWDITSPDGPWSLTEQDGAMNAMFAPSVKPDFCGATIQTASTSNSKIQKQGFFKVAKTIYYSNGNEAYCAIANWENYLAMGGAQNQSNVDTPAALPTGMRSDGVCAPPSGVIAAGYFKIDEGKTGIFYSNASHYCVYKDWAAFIRAGGKPDQSNVQVVAGRAPASMVNDGVCQ